MFLPIIRLLFELKIATEVSLYLRFYTTWFRYLTYFVIINIVQPALKMTLLQIEMFVRVFV